MAIKAILQSIEGKREGEVTDPTCSLEAVWPCGNQEYPLLQYIDPYGNAIYNGLQMPEIRRELDILAEHAQSDVQRNILRRVHELAVRCQEKPHLFLRFRGD